ncbi:MAG: SusC/RagA family TonB-linked outer membrane protein, partial [Bacteroidales bacterium]|nr:SusC/RagA family TonB-linked outer membrane protein [Bacteroidales bacterium]
MNRRKTFILFLSLLLATVTAFSQNKVTVTGVVMDDASLPLIGAVVTVPANPGLGGVMTDADGRFRFDVPVGSVIQVSLLGFAPWEQQVNGPADYMVGLEPETERLEDAVVVAYGTQKKESVVGSISQVKGEDLALSGTTNLTNALAGKVAGMNHFSTHGSGAPGEQDFSFMVRGLSSWNGNSPLVMVDGVERSLASLAPNEITSISVLKDASATAVYGAKGANGVILVTTKTGQKGKPKFHVDFEYGLEQPWRLPDHVDALTTSLMVNTGYRNQGSFGSMYSSRELQYYADGTDPLRYPDVNWYDILYKDFTTSYNLHANVSGGSDKIRYYFGANYTHQGSIVKGLWETQNSAYSNEPFGQDRYNYRFNLDFNPTRTTSVALKLGGTLTNTRSITEGGSSYFTGRIYQSPTTLYPAYYPAWALEMYPDPDYPDADTDRLGNNQGAYYDNPYAYVAHPDLKITQRAVFSADLIADQKLDFITKGLQAGGKISLTTGYSRIAAEVNKAFQKWDILWDLVDSGADNPWSTPTSSNYVWNDTPYSISQTNTAGDVEYNFYLEGAVRYKRKFAKKHNVSALALYSQREIDANASYPHRNQSLVGRLTYDYKGKYLLEGSIS